MTFGHPMAPSRFYKLAVWAPVLIPVLAIPFFGGRETEGPVPILAPVATVLALVGFFGAIPYLITASILSVWLRESNQRRARRTLLAAPLWMVLMTALCAVVVESMGAPILMDPVSMDTQLSVDWGFLAFACPLILVVGFPYVGFVLWLGRRLERRDGKRSSTTPVHPTAARGRARRAGR